MKAPVTWVKLIEELDIIVGRLENTNGTIQQEDRVALACLLKSYNSCRDDYEKYIHYDKTGYTKNLVKSYGSLCNVIVMCWAPLQGSSVHGHEGSNCFVKVLEGELMEKKMAYPNVSRSLNDAAEIFLKENDTTFIDDTTGVHKVQNNSEDAPAITLHIYIPAYIRARIFDGENNFELTRSRVTDVKFTQQAEIESSF